MMKKMLLLSSLLMFSSFTFAEDLSRDQILTVFEQLKGSGMIPAHEAPAVEKMIKEMSPDQLAKVQGLARGVASKAPAPQSDSAVEAANSIDMNSKEFIDAEEETKKLLK